MSEDPALSLFQLLQGNSNCAAVMTDLGVATANDFMFLDQADCAGLIKPLKKVEQAKCRVLLSAIGIDAVVSSAVAHTEPAESPPVVATTQVCASHSRWPTHTLR